MTDEHGGALRYRRGIATVDPSDRTTSVPTESGSLLAEIVATVTVALSAVGTSIALAALVFSGPLAGGLARGMTGFVLGGSLTTLSLGLFSKTKPVVAITQDGPIVVLVAVAAGLAKTSSGDPVLDVIVAVALVTVISAVAMFLIARLNLSSVVRYLPRTVISGFIAGTGWLLFKGGFDVMVDRNLGLADLDFLLQSNVLGYWVPGLALGLGMLMLSRIDRVPAAATGVSVIGAFAAFHLVVLRWSSMPAAEDGGWLVGPFPENSGVRFLTPSEVAGADWANLVGSFGPILTIVGVAMVALLLNLSGLEEVSGERVDLDAELTLSAGTNLLIAPLGGMIGFHALGDTALIKRMGATHSLVAILAGTIGVSFAIFGASVVGLVPRMLAGGLLVLVGLGLLLDWLHDLATSSLWSERILSAGILLLIATVGILEGIGFGIVAACGIFVYRYSRIDPVRHESTGNVLVSRVDRTDLERAELNSTGDQVTIFELQGYLFFGSVTRVADQIRARCADADRPLCYVVLDFHRVTGMDSSGFASVREIATTVSKAGATLLISDLPEPTRVSIERAEPSLLTAANDLPNLDEALELVENHQLMATAAKRVLVPQPPCQGDVLSAELRSWFSPGSAEADDVVMHRGEPSDSLQIVMSGELYVTQIDDIGVEHRLRRFGSGALLGEIGFLTDRPRTADVTAATDATFLSLDRPTYGRLRVKRPDLAIELHDYILRGQADRTASLTDNLARALR